MVQLQRWKHDPADIQNLILKIYQRMFAVDLLNWLAVSIVTSNPDDKLPKRRAGITNTSSNFWTQIWTPEILPYAL